MDLTPGLFWGKCIGTGGRMTQTGNPCLFLKCLVTHKKVTVSNADGSFDESWIDLEEPQERSCDFYFRTPGVAKTDEDIKRAKEQNNRAKTELERIGWNLDFENPQFSELDLNGFEIKWEVRGNFKRWGVAKAMTYEAAPITTEASKFVSALFGSKPTVAAPPVTQPATAEAPPVQATETPKGPSVIGPGPWNDDDIPF